MDNLIDQILALQLEIANLKRVAGRLKKLESRQLLEQVELTKLEQKVQKEYQDILELNKKSLIDLFVDRKEDREERLEKEKKDYYEAVMVLKNAEHRIKLLEFEINILREKTAALPEKERLLKLLKLKKKHTIDLSAKKESDKDIVVKNRFQVAFHKLIRSGQKIQVYLEQIQNSLFKIETWQTWNLSQAEKMKIFKEEFESIEKVLHELSPELANYNKTLQNLTEFEKYLAAADRSSLEKIESECLDLNQKLTLFAESLLNDLPGKGNLQNDLTKLKAKIVAIQYDIDQAAKLLQL